MIPLMRTTEAGDRSGLEAIPEPIRERIGEYGRNGSLSIATGAISVVRGLRALRSDRTRGFAKLLFGAGWILIGLVQRQHAGDDGLEGTIGGEDDADVDDVTPGETDDDIAAANTLPPSDIGDPDARDEEGEVDPVDTAAEPAEVTGPTGDDAAPETDKTTVPEEAPTEGVSMAGDDEIAEEEDIDESGDDEADDEDEE